MLVAPGTRMGMSSSTLQSSKSLSENELLGVEYGQPKPESHCFLFTSFRGHLRGYRQERPNLMSIFLIDQVQPFVNSFT